MQDYKQLWEDDELAIYNRQNKATFEALKLLYPHTPPFYFDSNEICGESIEVNNWQSLKKIKYIEVFHNDRFNLSEDAIYVEPEEVLKQLNNQK